MKVSITMDGFPMDCINQMIAELAKHQDDIDVQVGGGSTVFVTFSTPDIVQIQVLSIICDKYYHGGDSLGELLHGDEKSKLLHTRPV